MEKSVDQIDNDALQALHEQLNEANRLRINGDLVVALQHYNAILASHPRSPVALYHSGLIYHAMGDSAKAIAFLTNALKSNPKYADVYCDLGAIHVANDAPDMAVECFTKAISLNPDLQLAYRNLATVFQRLGQIDTAIDYFQKAIELNPEDTLAIRLLIGNTKNHNDYADIDTIEQLLQKELSVAQQADLHFALGKAYDDAHEYEKAFDHYAQGNKLHRETFQWDAKQHHNFVSRVIAFFSTRFFDEFSLRSTCDESPIFVVGMPRSGTTLVEQILSSHPEVFGAGEVSSLLRVQDVVSKLGGEESAYPEATSLMDVDIMDRLSAEYISILHKNTQGEQYVVDKTPFNFLMLGIIQLLFPKAKIIHCRRNPIDTSLSIFFQYFTAPVPFAYQLDEIADYYEEYERLMTHWRATIDLPILEVDYEKLVADQQNMTRKLIDFCGLEWNDDCLAFHKTKRNVQTASSWQVRQPIYKNSVERWRRYQEWVGPLQRLGH